MTQLIPSIVYDDDFFAWTQQQAVALRELPRDAIGNRVDIEHVAEEIEDLGKRDLREVRSLLKRLIEHLIKIDACPASNSLPHWRSEARSFSSSASEAFSPSMRQLLDLTSIWRKGLKAARHFLDDIGVPSADWIDCPFVLDELLSEDFGLDDALVKLAAARRERARDNAGP